MENDVRLILAAVLLVCTLFIALKILPRQWSRFGYPNGLRKHKWALFALGHSAGLICLCGFAYHSAILLDMLHPVATWISYFHTAASVALTTTLWLIYAMNKE